MHRTPTLEPAAVAEPWRERPRRRRPPSRLAALAGWIWRLALSAVLCMNPVASILVVGWLYRRLRERALYGWWKRSRLRGHGSFDAFRATLPAEAAPRQPRWFARAWVDLKVGCQALFCTFLLTGWGCGLTWFSWEYGWDNSFNKGYERAALGPLLGVGGILLCTLSLLYVPMAQVHHAVTGDYRAFFDFRFVWRLARARPLSYLGLA